MLTFEQLMSRPASFGELNPVAGFLNNETIDNEYPEEIELASDDSLQNWLLDQGYSFGELTEHMEAGISLRELATQLHNDGIYYPG